MLERFVKDYAEVKKSDILKNDFITEEMQVKAVTKINKILRLRNRGYITIDEAMLAILHCFEE